MKKRPHKRKGTQKRLYPGKVAFVDILITITKHNIMKQIKKGTVSLLGKGQTKRRRWPIWGRRRWPIWGRRRWPIWGGRRWPIRRRCRWPIWMREKKGKENRYKEGEIQEYFLAQLHTGWVWSNDISLLRYGARISAFDLWNNSQTAVKDRSWVIITQ